MNEAEYLRKLAKDFRLAGEDELCDKTLLALSAMTGSVSPKADLSYSYIMRRLRKNNPEKGKEFQTVFKETFDEAFLSGLEDFDDVVLAEVLQKVELSDEDLKATKKESTQMDRLIKLCQHQEGNPQLVGKSVAEVIRFLLRKIEYSKRPHAMINLKQKIWDLDENLLASKKSPDNAAIGQSITFVKTFLNGKPSGYVRQVLSEIVRNLY